MKKIKHFSCMLVVALLLPTAVSAQTGGLKSSTSTFNGMDVCRDQEAEPNRYAELYTVEGNTWMCGSNARFKQKTINGSFGISTEWASMIIINNLFHLEGYVRNITVRAGGNVEKMEVTYSGPDVRDVVIGVITPTSKEVQNYEFTVEDDLSSFIYLGVGEYSIDGNINVNLTPSKDGDPDVIIESITIEYIQKGGSGDGLSGSCGRDLTWFLSDDQKCLNIIGTGETFDYYEGGADAPWRNEFWQTINRVVIYKGLTKIGSRVFIGLQLVDDVSLPSTLKEIGAESFQGSRSLRNIELPDGLETIGSFAFYNSKIEALTIPVNLKEIYTFAFYNCPIKSIAVAEGNKYLDSRNNCNAAIKTATNELMLGCVNTVVPDDVVSIGTAAFSSVPNLKELVVPDGVTTIGRYGISNCSDLVTLTIGSGVTLISEHAFYSLKNLADVICTADPEKLTWEGNDNANCCKKDGTTQFHVADPAAWKAKFPNAHVQFVAIGGAETPEGDVSGDGKTDAEDVVALMDYLMGKAVAGINADSADVNKDGKVNVADVVALVNIILKK